MSTQNLLHNVAVLKKQAPGAQIIAMVKANAYGHGLRSVSLRLQTVVDSLGVASIDEALALRKAGVTIPITLMEGVFEPEELLVASCESFQVVFHEQTQLHWLRSAYVPAPITAWLKIDTGCGRLGFSVEEAQEVYQELSSSSHLVQPIGIMSHLACAEEQDHPLTREQFEKFNTFVQRLPGPKSISNSAATFLYPESRFDVIRPGLALYGISPLPGVGAHELDLKPVMTLRTQLIAVKNMRKGASLGYGARYVCPEDMPVGVIAMGYGDGLSRTAQDGMPLLVNGKICQLAGRVSMDMATIDLRSCPGARVGDAVTLWGEGLPIEQVAPFTSHTPYDLVTAVQSRVKFYWTLSK
jgi:alanine racemase